MKNQFKIYANCDKDVLIKRDWDCGEMFLDPSGLCNEEPVVFDNYALALFNFKKFIKHFKTVGAEEFCIYIEQEVINEDGEVEEWQPQNGYSYFHGAEFESLKDRMPADVFDRKVGNSE